ncbi:MAG: hypothetical protein F4X95_04320 [Oligoflexia bacterium]|nr:hypothetical protein [Oligoflexia bacterium]
MLSQNGEKKHQRCCIDQELCITKWVPELKPLNKKHIHFPPEWKKELPKTFKIGKHYSAPIVRHNIQRQKAICFQNINS